MARIKKTSFSPDFTALVEEAQAVGEVNDCSVKAVALVTGRPYREVHAAFAAAGRRSGRGTPRNVSQAALRLLGVQWREWSTAEKVAMIRSYPARSAGKRARSYITTTHWRRFPEAWAPHSGKRLIILTATHMLAVVDGEVKDWSVNHALRVDEIWEVV